jgi:purine-nucleoside phosphorylase
MLTMHNAKKTAARLSKLCSLRPTLALILGSGFQSAVRSVAVVAEIPYGKLPGFPKARIEGHGGHVLLGHLGGVAVIVLSGRAHYYEGYSMAEVTFPVRVLAEFGVRSILLTNAAGGIHPKYRAGDFMCLTDHINLMGANPLRGESVSGKTGFVDLTSVYDQDLNRFLRSAARRAKVRLHTGVYVAVSGPTYETPAEINAFARLGGHAVGMSTVPEAIVGRQCGLRVAGLSCITNLAAGRNQKPLSHAEVLAAGDRVQNQVSALIRNFVRMYLQVPESKTQISTHRLTGS